MISTLLAENPALLMIGIVLATLCCLVVACAIEWRGGRSRGLGGWIAIAGVAVVIVLTLLPDPRSAMTVSTCQLVPTNVLRDRANIALFYAPALFGTMWLRRPIVAALVGIALSATIETIQFLAPAVGRRCDIDDWISNSAGTVLGVVSAVAISFVVARLRNRRTPGPSQPSDLIAEDSTFGEP